MVFSVNGAGTNGYLVHFPKGSVAQFSYNFPKLLGVQVPLHMFVLLLLLLAPQLEDLTEIEEGHFSSRQSSSHLSTKSNNKKQSFSSLLAARARRAAAAGAGFPGSRRSGRAVPGEGGARYSGSGPRAGGGVWGVLRGRPLCRARPAGRAGRRRAPGRPSGGGTCPDARRDPTRSKRSGRPRPPRLRPVSRRVSWGGGHSGRGTRPAAPEAGSRQAELSRLRTRAQGLLHSRLLPRREARASLRF